MKCAFPKCTELTATKGLCPEHNHKYFGIPVLPTTRNINLLAAYMEMHALGPAKIGKMLQINRKTVEKWEAMPNIPTWLALVVFGLIHLDGFFYRELAQKLITSPPSTWKRNGDQEDETSHN